MVGGGRWNRVVVWKIYKNGLCLVFNWEPLYYNEAAKKVALYYGWHAITVKNETFKFFNV